MTQAFYWPYFRLDQDGRLRNEAGRLVFPNQAFENAAQAEAWLAANDLRGNVR